MRYLKQAEILPYLRSGKEVEQFINTFYHEGFKCYRYVVIGKNKEGYYALIFEKFDDADEGIDSIYNYSSIEPDDLHGRHFGPFASMKDTITAIRRLVTINPDSFLISGQLDQVLKLKPTQ